MNPAYYLNPIDRLHQEHNQFLRSQQFRRYYTAEEARAKQVELARKAEQLVARQVQSLGYQVNLTTHKCPFDLWVADYTGRTIQVEVKLSLYHQHKRGGRYQANVRHDQADLLVFIARNGRDWSFVIPMADISPRNNITIWSFCPGEHSGQWAKYLEAWDYLHLTIEQTQPRLWQPSLFTESKWPPGH
jgi:hypothetical protein